MSASDPDKLFLIDGHALAYRSHFAFINANLRNADGIPTGPLLGFANTLVKLLETARPTHIAVVWDTSAPTFRHEMDENYKANRPPQPDELRQTIPLMKEMVSYLGFQNLQQDGYEADDIIGTIAYKAGADGTDVFMVTPDKDFMQLVTEKVRMLKPLTKGDGFKVIDPEGVVEYFGVPPEKVVDVLAIIGDTSDNIPGVPGIGKKGAPKLIQKYGSLEAAIEAAPGMKAKRAREGLGENKEQALLSKKMIVINTAVPDTCAWTALKWDGPQTEPLVDFFKRMEFNTLRRKFSGEAPPPKAINKTQGDLFSGVDTPASTDDTEPLNTYIAENVIYKLVKTPAGLSALAEALAQADAICFDTETTGTDALTAELVGLAFAVKAGEAWYLSIDESGQKGLPLADIKEALANFLSADTLKIAHNYKYDFTVLHRHGMELKGRIFDTMIAAYLIDSAQRLSMDELSKRYLNYRPISITELIGKGKQQKSMRDIPVEEVYPYACEDADITFQLYELLHKKLEEDALLKVAETLEFPLIPVLAHMEMNGVKLDTEMLAGFSQQLGEDMRAVQQKIYEAAGEEFNINSPAQLSKILFEKLELPSGKKTKSGSYSTGEQILSELAHSYEIASLVLDYRSLSKLKSTYADALPKLINEESGRVHTSFNQQIAATGRLSSSHPNLQNIPIRTERGREI
ncbi:MAG: DNA polymerase I, partial [Cyclonatronaceae bacterium]